MIQTTSRTWYPGIPLLLALFWSCSTGTDPGSCEEVKCRRIGYYMEVSRNNGKVDSLEPALVARATFLERGGIIDQIGIWSSGDQVRDVKFNGTGLSEYGKYSYRYDALPRPSRLELRPPGDSNVWVVRPTYGDSLTFSFVTPESPSRITLSPAYPSDTISADSDLRISWPSSSSDPDVRSSLFTLVLLEDSSGGGRQIFLNLETEFRGFTSVDHLTIPADSLKAWISVAQEVRFFLRLDHYRIQDNRLNDATWARTVFIDSETRRLFLRPE